jgi:ribosomal protein S6
MKTYELTYIISPEMTSEEAEAKAKELEQAIQSREGVILKQQNPVAKTLAFQIEKRASGFFGVLEFQMEPEKLLEIKEIVEKEKKIVRHIVLVKEPVRIRRDRRKKVEVKVEQPTVVKTEEQPAPVVEKTKEKVELKDIEDKLEEILGQ